MNQDSHLPEEPRPAPAWEALTREQRRVVGVLIEKSKTTPAAYPLTVNSITTACNQKSNRYPLMTLTSDEIEDLLYELRELGAVVEVQGSGRTEKYRHNMYDWLGIDKVEMAVMGELLLRGEQTLGELRGRAARMNPIADLAALKPIVAGLMEKNLVQTLTPEGRGQIVTHNLYHVHELEKVESHAQSMAGDKVVKASGGESAAEPAAKSAEGPSPVTRQEPADSKLQEQRIDQLSAEISALKEMIEMLSERLQQLEQ